MGSRVPAAISDVVGVVSVVLAGTRDGVNGVLERIGDRRHDAPGYHGQLVDHIHVAVIQGRTHGFSPVAAWPVVVLP